MKTANDRVENGSTFPYQLSSSDHAFDRFVLDASPPPPRLLAEVDDVVRSEHWHVYPRATCCVLRQLSGFIALLNE